jgi:hypothetical protein
MGFLLGLVVSVVSYALVYFLGVDLKVYIVIAGVVVLGLFFRRLMVALILRAMPTQAL